MVKTKIICTIGPSSSTETVLRNVMLSEETAAGNHPVEAVRMMNEIIKFTEGFILNRPDRTSIRQGF